MKHLLYLFLLLLFACGGKKSNERILARVGEQYLYVSDLDGVVLPGTSSSDSIQLVKNFVSGWIKQLLLVQHAREAGEGIPEEELQQKLDKYRGDLQLASYEQNYLKKHLDTVVSKQQIQQYYQKNPGLFALDDYVVNVFYMKFDDTEKGLDNIGQQIKKCADPVEAKSIEAQYSSSALNSYLEPESWLYFSDLLREIPLEVEDKGNFIKNNSFFEVNNDGNTYFVRIFGYKLKSETSPVNMVENKIKDLILRNRSKQLLDQLRKDIMKKNNGSNNVENYVK